MRVQWELFWSLLVLIVIQIASQVIKEVNISKFHLQKTNVSLPTTLQAMETLFVSESRKFVLSKSKNMRVYAASGLWG